MQGDHVGKFMPGDHSPMLRQSLIGGQGNQVTEAGSCSGKTAKPDNPGREPVMLGEHLNVDRGLELNTVVLLQLLVGFLEQGNEIGFQDLVIILGKLENKILRLQLAMPLIHMT